MDYRGRELFKVDQANHAHRRGPGTRTYCSSKKLRPRQISRTARFAAGLGLFAVMVGVGVFFTTGPQGDGAVAAGAGRVEWLARLAGFGIDEVVLTGHRQTADTDIFNALDLPRARSLLSLNTRGVRRRLEQLPWIAGAEITRVYPNRLEIRVKERKPFAAWQRTGGEYLIDVTGRVLTEINRSNGLDLPRVAGEGAAREARALFAALARYPAIAKKLERAERIGGRRWTLHLRNGTVLQLPADREISALAMAAENSVVERGIREGNAVIDLRVLGRIAVRHAGPSGASAGS